MCRVITIFAERDSKNPSEGYDNQNLKFKYHLEVDMWKQQLQFLAIIAFGLALVLTGVGGWSDLMGRSIQISKQHAWNDGLFMILVAIFLVLLSQA